MAYAYFLSVAHLAHLGAVYIKYLILKESINISLIA